MALFSRRKDLTELRDARDFAALAKIIKKDDEQRRAATDLLIEMKDPACVPPLVGIMDDMRTGGEALAASNEVFGHMGPDLVLEPLIEELRKHEWGAVHALMKLGDAVSLPRLLRLIEEEDQGERTHQPMRNCEFAYTAILELKTQAANEAFVKGLISGPARYSAFATAWTRWSGEEAEIIRAIFSVAEGDNPDLYTAAEKSLQALAKRINKGDVPGDEGLTTLAGLLTHENGVVRATAANTLGLVYGKGVKKEDPVPDPRTADALAAACSDPEELVRFKAAFALSQQNDRRATPVLIEMLDQAHFVDLALAGLIVVKDPAAFDKVDVLYKNRKTNGVGGFALGIAHEHLSQARKKETQGT